MEKKRTKIAYFTAVGVFLVLLVVLGLTYRETPLPTLEVEGEPVLADTPFAGTFWSLLPPIVAIVLALISKEVYSSLFLGCLVGALLYAQFAPWDTIVALVGADYGIVSVLADSGNMGIIVFLVTLGIMVDLMNKGGGSEAFGRWASKTVRTRCAAQLLTMLLGVLIFIDDYFNCLTVGAVMRPVTESHKISRAKLAYLIDATAAPVCMIAPVSSWAAAVSGYVQSDAVNGIEMFIKQIPWNYYCLLTLVMIVVLSVMNIDYGSMLTHEYNAQVKDDLFTTPERPFEGADDYEKPARGRSSVLDLLLPVVVLIVVCIVSLIWSGGYYDGESEYFHDFVGAFSNSSSGMALALGGLMGMLFTVVYFWLRGAISFEKSMEFVPQGFIQMIAPILILTFAWTLCSFTRFGMYSAVFVKNAMAGAGDLKVFLPAVIFLIGCAIGFATGTSWGTIGIMAPIVVSVFNYDVEPVLCTIGLAAACSGGVMGDHCSPISDTTIMASAGAHCFHLNHVFTQLPYALTASGVAFVSFIIAGTRAVGVAVSGHCRGADDRHTAGDPGHCVPPSRRYLPGDGTGQPAAAAPLTPSRPWPTKNREAHSASLFYYAVGEKLRADDLTGGGHGLHDVIHIGDGANGQLVGETVVVQAGAAGADLHTLCLHVLQVLDGDGTLGGDLGAAVIEQDGAGQTLLLAQGVEKALHQRGTQRIVTGAKAVGADDHHGVVPVIRGAGGLLRSGAGHGGGVVYRQGHHE